MARRHEEVEGHEEETVVFVVFDLFVPFVLMELITRAET
jgi:hypothetical protein